MQVLSSESVLADLRRYPLLTPEHMARVESAAGRSTLGPGQMVKRLVDRGWLTQFQADVLLGGKAAGLVFGHYVLLSRLGEGGMGAVFKARHVRLQRIDALKVIRGDKIASKVVARRFLREIQLTADLNHPHIIKALDAGQVGRQLYLATEFISGEDLTATVCRDGPFSVADACLVIYQTALALRHIHERGLIHRDLKPSNIMREDKTRIAKLLDLGLSNSLHQVSSAGSKEGTLTRDGVMLGTPDFMPPEQARDPHGVDIRADLYALGGTFFFLLTGRTPYEGSTVEKLLHHATSPPPRLVLPHSPAPPALTAIIEKAMAKRPEDRFQTPQELIDALIALRPCQTATISDIGFRTMDGSPAEDEWRSQFDLLIAQDASASGRNPLPENDRSRHKRRSGDSWVIAAAAAVIAGSIGLFVFVRNRAAYEPVSDSAAVEEESVDELKALRRAVLAGENRDQLRGRVLSFRARHAGQAAGAGAAALLRKLPSPLDRLAPVSDGAAESPVVRLTGTGTPVAWMAFAPSDERLMIVRPGEAPEEWEPLQLKETGRFNGLMVAEGHVASVAPDGRTAAAVGAAGKLIVGRDGRVRTIDVGPGLAVADCAVTPDGKSAVVAFAGTEERLAKVHLDTGTITGRLDHSSAGVMSLAVSPDGSSCLAIGRDDGIRLLSLISGKRLHSFDRPSEAVGAPSARFGPDGQRVYLIGAYRTAGRFALGTSTPAVHYEVGQEANSFRPRLAIPGRPTCVAVSADEAAVAVGTRAGSLYVYAAATGKPTQEFRFRQPIRGAAFSTHGRVLAVALTDGSVLLVPLKG
jgi:serine/threonine protein kinase/DNA-binding beta-propeller fold protein YncE